MVLNNGTLSSGVIIRRPNTSPIYGGAAYNHAPQSESILYDKAGQRTSVAVTNAYYDTYGASVTGVEELREIYTYDPAGRLIRSDQSTGTLVSAPTQAQIDAPAAAPTTGTRRSTYSYDAMGRQLGQVDYKVDGTTAVYSRTISYNARGL
ncbi:MAG: hypothetical protein J7496_09960 [Novosphingobium sp.]|nr:hypothetical protein [Novosphingobium sp.]